jgi:sodium/potassium-transporting ATPase subunit alpha
MLFAICVAFIFCYIPGLQKTIATREVPVEHWFLPAAFGLGLLILDEVRKYCVRKWPNGLLAKIAW